MQIYSHTGTCYLLNTVTQRVGRFKYPLIEDKLNKNEILRLNIAKTNHLAKKKVWQSIYSMLSSCHLLHVL